MVGLLPLGLALIIPVGLRAIVGTVTSGAAIAVAVTLATRQFDRRNRFACGGGVGIDGSKDQALILDRSDRVIAPPQIANEVTAK